MWRALSLVAPSLKLNPEHPQPLFSAPFYPIGVAPDLLLQPQNLFAIYRDTYANTSCVINPYPILNPKHKPKTRTTYVLLNDTAAAVFVFSCERPPPNSYDMTQGLAAAPWGLPVRFDPEQAYKGSIPGNWERPIGLFRTVRSCVPSRIKALAQYSIGLLTRRWERLMCVYRRLSFAQSEHLLQPQRSLIRHLLQPQSSLKKNCLIR